MWRHGSAAKLDSILLDFSNKLPLELTFDATIERNTRWGCNNDWELLDCPENNTSNHFGWLSDGFCSDRLCWTEGWWADDDVGSELGDAAFSVSLEKSTRFVQRFRDSSAIYSVERRLRRLTIWKRGTAIGCMLSFGVNASESWNCRTLNEHKQIHSNKGECPFDQSMDDHRYGWCNVC